MENFWNNPGGPGVSDVGSDPYMNLDGMRNIMSGAAYAANPTLRIEDLWFSLKMCLVLLLLRMVLCGALHPKLKNVPNLCRSLLRRFSKDNKQPKFTENLWYSIWHSISFCWCMYVLYQEWNSSDDSWLRLFVITGQPRWLWVPTGTEKQRFSFAEFPLTPPSEPMRAFYLTELAFWVSCLLFICFETIRHDFHVLLVHHLATCLLIGFSHLLCFWRIGSIILALHDIVDIFLYAAKTLHYSKASNLVDGVFVAFVFVFFIARLVLYPMYCVWPALDIWTIREITGGLVYYHWDIPGGCILPAFLCVLQGLHIFWFRLILEMVFKTVKQKALHVEKDIRSEDEDDDKPVTKASDAKNE